MNDIVDPATDGYGRDWIGRCINAMENAVSNGNKIHFDLTYMDDTPGDSMELVHTETV